MLIAKLAQNAFLHGRQGCHCQCWSNSEVIPEPLFQMSSRCLIPARTLCRIIRPLAGHTMAYSDKTHKKHRNGLPPSREVDPTDEHMSIGRYIATRIPTLKPPMTKAPNPIRLLRMLTFQQWMFFLVSPASLPSVTPFAL